MSVVFLRYVLLVFRGADVCSILPCLRIGLEELALFLVAGPPGDELARAAAVRPLPAPGAQVQCLGGGEGSAVAAPVRFAVVIDVVHVG